MHMPGTRRGPRPALPKFGTSGSSCSSLPSTAADEGTHDGETVLLDIGLYSVTDIPYPIAAARHLNAAMQAFFGNIQQPLGLEVDLAARIGAGIIAVEAVDLAAGVDRDDDLCICCCLLYAVMTVSFTLMMVGCWCKVRTGEEIEFYCGDTKP